MERIRDIAHLSAVELRTPDLDATVDFFTRLVALDEVHRADGVAHLHCWDDYETFTPRVVQHETSGTGHVGTWDDGELGFGRTYVVPDPDGHLVALYWDSTPYDPPEGLRPSLKNQAAAFPGRGANVRRLDHVNYLARDVRANGAFLENGVSIETGPHKHAIQQTFCRYVFEPGGNRIELCNAGARLLLSPDSPPVGE